MSFLDEQDDSLSLGSLDPPSFDRPNMTKALENKIHDSIVNNNQRMCTDIGKQKSSSAFFWDSTDLDEMIPDDDDNPLTPRSNESIDNHHDNDNNNPNRNNLQSVEEEPRLVLGYPIPSWWKDAPSCNQVAGWVVRNAPCFWGCRRRLRPGATDRSILLRLNILCAFFAAGQLASAVGIATFLYSDQIIDRTTAFDSDNETGQVTPNLWNTNVTVLILGLLGLVIFISMIVTLWVIREVNLVGALHYMWTLLWIIPVELFLVIGLFDYHRVTKVWIRHWWRAPTMAFFRKIFCQDGTYNNKCLVPLGGAPFLNETSWCWNFFNATNCTQIRNDAQEKVFRWTYLYYTLNGVWGVLLIALLWMAIGVLEGIITQPVVQSSRESNVPFWLSGPTIGCGAVGSILLFSPSSIVQQASESGSSWIGVVYLVCGLTFFISALLGWFISAFSILNSRDKRNKIGAVLLFITLMMGTILLIGTIFSASIAWSVNLVTYPITDDLRGIISCSIDTASSCSQCDNPLNLRECPEWSTEDVVRILRTQLKQSATLAAIVLIYSVGSLRFGFILRKHIASYQIDYV